MKNSTEGNGSELQTATNRFIELGRRFVTEVDALDVTTREVAEKIFNDACETAVEALIKSGGDDNIMQALELEFTRPILKRFPRHDRVIRIMIAHIAVQIAQQLPQNQPAHPGSKSLQ